MQLINWITATLWKIKEAPISRAVGFINWEQRNNNGKTQIDGSHWITSRHIFFFFCNHFLFVSQETFCFQETLAYLEIYQFPRCFIFNCAAFHKLISFLFILVVGKVVQKLVQKNAPRTQFLSNSWQESSPWNSSRAELSRLIDREKGSWLLRK